MLLQKAKRLEADAEMLWSDGNEAAALAANKELHAIEMQNEIRLNAAIAALEAFDADVRDDAELNASQTSPWLEMIAAGKHGEPLGYCEYWELAVRSATDIVECR